MAGRHVSDSSLRTLCIADGVNGLLMASKLNLVVCALTSFAESLNTRRGFGGLSILSVTVVSAVGLSDIVNWPSRVSVDVIRSLRARMSFVGDVELAIFTY